ncbi:glycosyltransferase [Burkholderia cenocepacia]|uniref:glycosyltransferase n=1 Tax=Burkholderia cepacia complex TaxID=87882 RepID=UPI000F5B68D7|nr:MULTISPECIES: glycosyltransferase [Burkholderia cepacia complex]ELW9447903.1 glycosyltransferase [Burkholderia cenocepacia]MBN3566433.1 glycosyltransferase [Burkholderia cenocepacia]MBR8109896.1 glycosyltransferase [Burkholderia cenocepacia]MBR8482238.1 glycosyltransferase [Burkholderia cenocepacia]MDN7471542.1 glycosyltransferase [Burkholderia orbicola]
MSDSMAGNDGLRREAPAVRVVWFLGPRPVSWNGVMRYSLKCIDFIPALAGFDVEPVDIPAEPRSLRRYWTQFVLYPLRAIAAARAGHFVMLYQEDLAFMIPLIRWAGGRVGIVLHHVQRPGQVRGVVEQLKNAYMRLTQSLIATADVVLAPSDVTAQEALADLRIRADRIQVVPNAFDDRYAPIDAEVRARARAMLLARFGIDTGEAWVVLNVGSDETRKNNATLFRALASLGRKDVMMLRVGSAQNQANREECRGIAAQAGISAHFVENVGDEDLGYFFQASDLYVSPTLHEGFGRTVIEAQFVGVPVVATDLPVYRYTMGDSFVAVANAMDAAEWGRQIERVAGDPSLRAALVSAGRANARRFSSGAVSAQLHNALERAVHDRPRAGRAPA